jgi:AcrR family transcriptional regulator
VARPREYDDDLRTRLIEAAARLLVAEGLHAVSLRRVAGEVGTSTTAIYSLLGGKEGLLRAMYVEGFQRLADHLAAVPPHDDPLEHLVQLGYAYHQSAVDSPHLYRVMFDCPIPEFQVAPEDVELALGTLQVLVDAVACCVDAGLLPPPAEELAVELWAVNHGITSLAISGMLGTSAPARVHLDRMVRATVAGYRQLVAPAG